MILNATYIANWKHIKTIRRANTLRNNLRENAKRRHHDYKIDDMVLVSNKDVKRKIWEKQGPFRIVTIYTNGTVSIQRSTSVVERINIRRLTPC